MIKRATSLFIAFFVLSGCETKVYPLTETAIASNSPLLSRGFTHAVLVDTPLANLAGTDNGDDRLLRAALEFCGLPPAAGQDAIQFETTMDTYLTSNAVFACIEPGKDTQ